MELQFLGCFHLVEAFMYLNLHFHLTCMVLSERLSKWYLAFKSNKYISKIEMLTKVAPHDQESICFSKKSLVRKNCEKTCFLIVSKFVSFLNFFFWCWFFLKNSFRK